MCVKELISSQDLRAIVFNWCIGSESCLYIKSLSHTFDFALLSQPVKNGPYVTTVKSCLVCQSSRINALFAPFDNIRC
jgi:hypothetical protein